MHHEVAGMIRDKDYSLVAISLVKVIGVIGGWYTF